MYVYEKYAINKTIKATSVNTSGGKVSFSIGISTLSDNLKQESMRYVLSTNATSCTQDIVASGSFKDKTAGSDIWLIKNDYDNITRSGNNYTKTYLLFSFIKISKYIIFTH